MPRTPRLKVDLTIPPSTNEVAFMASVLDQMAARGMITSRVAGRAADLTLTSQTEMETLQEWIWARMGQTGGPTGIVSSHVCSHAQGEDPSTWTSCKDDGQARLIERVA